MADANYKVSINVDSKSDDSGVKQSQSSLNSWVGTATKAAASAAAVGAVMKQAFDLSNEGANINQARESFDRFIDSVGASPDTLDQMSAAVGGTVKELDLMSSTLTLVAGMSEDAGKQFLNNVPQLLEIAKAANKLNPSLGSTSFLFDSLSRGIKRGSPLLIDNTGLIIKSGEANENLARSLGKTVEELTAAEKQQAIMNAVLEAGIPLIDSVGGNVDSQADAWARLTVKIGENTDSFKSWFAEGILPTIQILNGDYANALLNAAENSKELTVSILENSSGLEVIGVKAGNLLLLKQAFDEGKVSADEMKRILAGLVLGGVEVTTAAVNDLNSKIEDYDKVTGDAIKTNEDFVVSQQVVIDTVAVHADQLAKIETLNARAVEVQVAQAEGAAAMMETRAKEIKLERELAEQRASDKETERLDALEEKERRVTEAKKEQDEINRLFTERRAEQHTQQLEMIRLEEEAQKAANQSFLEFAYGEFPDAADSIEQQLLKMAVAAGALSPDQFVELSRAAGVGDEEIATGLQAALTQQALTSAVSALGQGANVGDVLGQLSQAQSALGPEQIGVQRDGEGGNGWMPVFESPESYLSNLQSLIGTINITVDARGASDPLAVQNAAQAGANSAINAAMQQAGQRADAIRRTR